MTTPTDSGIVTDEGLVIEIAKAMFDEWPLRAITPHLAEMSGEPINTVLTWDKVLEMGGNHDGLIRLARGAAHHLTSALADERKRIGELIFAGNEMADKAFLLTFQSRDEPLNAVAKAAIDEWTSLSQRPTDGADR